jgi:hypothetical protein
VLALSTGVRFWFNIPLTIASAAIAISASFIGLTTGLFWDIFRRRRFGQFVPLHNSTPDTESPYDDDIGSVDFLTRSSFSQAGESHTSSTRAELEALLSGSDDSIDLLGDSWAKDYLVTRLLWTAWYSCTIENVIRGFCLGLVFITMHYSGSMASFIRRSGGLY